MMTRNATAFSFRDLLPLACGFIALSSATFAVSCYAEEQLPIANFLNRAQSEVNARRFDRLLSTLGKKPVLAVHGKSEPVVVAKSLAAATTSAPATTGAPATISTPTTISAPVIASTPAIVEANSATSTVPVAPKVTVGQTYAKQIAARLEKPRKTKAVIEARSLSKDAWRSKASGFLQRYGVHF